MSVLKYNQFAINFGGLNVLIACENPNFAQRLQLYYKQFAGTCDGQEASLSLHLIDEPVFSLWDEPELIWTSKGLKVEAAEYSGWIENASLKAELHLSRFYPIQKVDHFLRIAAAVWVFQIWRNFISCSCIGEEWDRLCIYRPFGKRENHSLPGVTISKSFE